MQQLIIENTAFDQGCALGHYVVFIKGANGAKRKIGTITQAHPGLVHYRRIGSEVVNLFSSSLDMLRHRLECQYC